ncbi:MAG: DUF58 domain-containing protein [Planctomycetes bacterium]|nr:DUF58 domain-containing protein [Planctomycetota bacterium]
MRRRYHIHPPGLLYLLLVVLVGLAAANRPSNLLIWVFAAMLAGVLLSGILSGQPLMNLRAQRIMPRTARVGEPVIVRYAISNGSSAWPLFALFVREAAAVRGSRAFAQHVGPGEEVVAETALWPERRGPLRLSRFRVETVFPFGLVMKSVRFDEPAECLVLPRIERLRPGVLASLAGGSVPGPSTSTRPGAGSDFLGIREYRPGDSLRHVAWRRSASTGTLAVIERSVDAPPRIRVAVDLRRPTSQLRADADARAPRDLEEDAIVLAASLLAAAQRDGYETRLCVLGLPSPSMPMRRGHWHLQKELAVLASLDLDAARDAGASLPEDRERAATFVVHVDRADLRVAGPDAVHLGAGQLPALAGGAAGGAA